MAVNWDFSNIIMGNHSGANIGRGIEQAASAVARGITNYRADQKEKEANQSAADLIKQIGGQYGINTADDGEIKAIIKATGGGAQAMQFLTQMQQAKQQKEEHDLRSQQLKQVLAAQQAQTQQRQTDATALQSAIAPRANDQYGAQLGYLLKNPPPATRDPTSSEILKSYIKGGGALNPNVLKAAQMQAQPTPGGFSSAAEARASIPAGSRGQVQQAANGRYIVQYQVGPAAVPPGSEYERIVNQLDASGALDKPTEQQLPREKALFERLKSLNKVGAGNTVDTILGDGSVAGSAIPGSTQTASADMPRPKTKAERDALPPGTSYLGPDGKVYTKR